MWRCYRFISTVFNGGVLLACATNAWTAPRPNVSNELNLFAGSATIYEVQVRTANACRVDEGADWQRVACAKKISPSIQYRAQGGNRSACGALEDLEQIKLGTLDDMLEDTNDFHAGITLRYIREQVGANVVWLMPLFPNNRQDSIPDACDNLGSPYAVRDYMHVSGTLDRRCILQGVDENSFEEHQLPPCWGDESLDALIRQAHERGLKVMLDVALNHFGHRYQFYDYAQFTSLGDRLSRGENPDRLWDYAGTFEQNLVWPEILDTSEKLQNLSQRNHYTSEQLNALLQRCPKLKGDLLVRTFNLWRNMMLWEKDRFSCESQGYLEDGAPGFYLGGPGGRPSSGGSDYFQQSWQDVKFLFHQEYSRSGDTPPLFYNEFVRNREYLFRVLNYWVSKGVDGFRLDHTTDSASGMGPNEWKYIIGKVNYYNWVRKGRRLLLSEERPIYLAEEFDDQHGMSQVVDVMTDGYVGDMRGRSGAIKNASFVMAQLEKENRFQEKTYVLRALETHDEPRLYENTGFDHYTGAGFWGLGAASRGTAMLLMGQEFGESWGLGFRRSDFLRSRFLGNSNHIEKPNSLIHFYAQMSQARRDYRNSALISPYHWFLKTRKDQVDERIVAQAKWDPSNGNVIFTLNNLWNVGDLHQEYYIPPQLAERLFIMDHVTYRLVDILSGEQTGTCFRGSELKWNFKVDMPASERLRWLRLETCF